MAELVAIRIQVMEKQFIFVSVYLPPMNTIRKRIQSVNELARSITHVRKDNPAAQILAIGDFNSPTLKWEYDDDDPGSLFCRNVNLSTAESKLVAFAAQHRLSQINSTPNGRGTFLDLCFTSSYENCKTSRADTAELIEPESTSHFAMEVLLSFQANISSDESKKTYNFIEKSNKIRAIMNSSNFGWFNEHEETQASPEQIEVKIDDIIDSWRNIRQLNTVTRIRNLPINLATHSWCKDAKYRALFSIKRRMKAKYLSNQSSDNKQELKIANEKLHLHYKTLKLRYHQKMVDNIEGDAAEFYDVMRKRNKNRAQLPIVMFLQKRQFIGTERHKAIAGHLASVFENDDYFLTETNTKLESIHGTYYSHQHHQLWQNYSEFFYFG